MLAADPNKPPTMQVEIAPAKPASVAGEWSGSTWKQAGNYAYPDLSSILFNPTDHSTIYLRNGSGILLSPPNILQRSIYLQVGSRIYFDGFNEKYLLGQTIGYFGVMSPDGKKVFADSRNFNARLPNYINTNEPYGPNGATPTIERR